VPGGPADDAGQRAGDRNVSVGATKVSSPDDVASAVLKAKPGDEIKVGVQRSGDAQTLTVKLGTRPTQIPSQIGG
ncbi:MAG: putative serine protease PepD, partial [bacterium]